MDYWRLVTADCGAGERERERRRPLPRRLWDHRCHRRERPHRCESPNPVDARATSGNPAEVVKIAVHGGLLDHAPRE